MDRILQYESMTGGRCRVRMSRPDGEEYLLNPDEEDKDRYEKYICATEWGNNFDIYGRIIPI
jgi:hypothetical protein